MEVTHGRDLDFESASKISKHRSGGIEFKFLATGIEGTPENFVFELARQSGFYSPVHRHNFDQFRYAYKGDFNLKPNVTLKQGQLSYHPEGTYYGPQDDGPDEQVLLLLQFGGASGQGFIPYSSLIASNKALSETGEFKGGKYYPNDGENPVDGFQANWEYIKQQKMVYPAPRYHDPIIMIPENFAHKPYPAGKSAFRKLLGVFSEREARVEMISIEAGGKVAIGGDDAIHILFTLGGDGHVEAEMLSVESTIKLNAGASCEISTDSGIEMLHFVMPMLA